MNSNLLRIIRSQQVDSSSSVIGKPGAKEIEGSAEDDRNAKDLFYFYSDHVIMP